MLRNDGGGQSTQLVIDVCSLLDKNFAFCLSMFDICFISVVWTAFLLLNHAILGPIYTGVLCLPNHQIMDSNALPISALEVLSTGYLLEERTLSPIATREFIQETLL